MPAPKLLLFVFLLVPGLSVAQGLLPMVNVTEDASGATEYSLTLQILLLMSALTLLPSLLIMMTSFVRIIIVLSLLRQAIGTGQTPPNQVLVGIALFLTLFIMSPVMTEVYEESMLPFTAGEISQEEAISRAVVPVRSFMLAQTRENDLNVFMDMANLPVATSYEDVPMTVLVPAFMTSELKTAFTIGFLIYIPFVIIDLVVASVLMAMGMMMLSPMMISMPFKLMLFVLADGWLLIMQSISASFAGN
jgi:flagellar biosynthetic protein FliP